MKKEDKITAEEIEKRKIAYKIVESNLSHKAGTNTLSIEEAVNAVVSGMEHASLLLAQEQSKQEVTEDAIFDMAKEYINTVPGHLQNIGQAYMDGVTKGLSLPQEQSKQEVKSEMNAKNLTSQARSFFVKHFDLPDTIQDSSTMGATLHQFITCLEQFAFYMQSGKVIEKNTVSLPQEQKDKVNLKITDEIIESKYPTTKDNSAYIIQRNELRKEGAMWLRSLLGENGKEETNEMESK